MTIEQKTQDGRTWKHPFRREKWESLEIGTPSSPTQIRLDGDRHLALFKMGRVEFVQVRRRGYILSEYKHRPVSDNKINDQNAPWAGKVRWRPNS